MKKSIFIFVASLALSGCGAQMGSQHAKTVATSSAVGSTTENATDHGPNTNWAINDISASYQQHP